MMKNKVSNEIGKLNKIISTTVS